MIAAIPVQIDRSNGDVAIILKSQGDKACLMLYHPSGSNPRIDCICGQSIELDYDPESAPRPMSKRLRIWLNQHENCEVVV